MPLSGPQFRSPGFHRRTLWLGFFVLSVLCMLLVLGPAFSSLAQRRVMRRAESDPKRKPAPPARAAGNLRNLLPQQKLAPDGSLLGETWTGAEAVSESTAEIMERERQRAALPQRQEPINELEHARPNRQNLPQNPNALPGEQWPPLSAEETKQLAPARHLVAAPAAPQPVTLNFTGATLADSGAFPPDSMGAVGPTQFLLVINGRIRVFDKNTGAVGPLDADTNTFFNSVRANATVSDPRVRYDRLSSRWFVVMINVPASLANNSILLAVSDSATITPNTVWRFFGFQQQQPATSGDSGCFSDYPTLGIDAQALYIGTDQFCGVDFAGTAAFVIRKSSVLFTGPLVVTAFRNLTGTPDGPGLYTPQGVDNYDPAATEGYFIGADNSTLGRLAVRRVSNPGGTPTLSANIFVNVLSTSVPLKIRHAGNNNGTNGFLDSIDDRLYAAHMRNGRLWTAHNIAVTNTGSTEGNRTRTAARWYELSDLNTDTPKPVQAGTLFAESATNSFNDRNYFMPSIVVSGQGHAALGASSAGANEAANAVTAGRLASDPRGALRAPVLLTNSSAAYNPARNTGNDDGFRRWGDYSYTSVDPCDDMTLWTIQEFCNATDSWGVQIARLQAPPPATPAGVNPPSVPAGLASTTITVTGIAANGAGFFDPGTGFNCRLQAQVSGGVTVSAVSYVNPATVRLTISTTNASTGLKNITIINPDGQSITANNLLTVGNCAYTVAPTQQSFTAAGGNSSVTVTAAAGCGWTAVSNDAFITVTSTNPSSGNGTVTYTVAPTVAGARSGTLTIAGQTVTITQNAGAGCNFTLAPGNAQFKAGGGYGTFNVSTPVDCVWTAGTASSFVNLLFSTAGQGNGAVNFYVAPNATPIARTATIAAGGQNFNLTQEAAPLEIAVDDGSLETATGLGAGGTSVRVNRLTPPFYPATVGAVAIYFPDALGVNVGDPFTLLAGANLDGDENLDGTPFQETAVTVKALGDFNVYTLSTPLTINSGDFVLGMRLNHAEGVRPFARDTTLPSRRRSYRQVDGATAFQLIDDPPVNTPGNYGIRAQLIRPAKLLVKGGAVLTAESCLPANGVIDPGETVTVNLTVQNNGSSSTDNLSAALQPTGGVTTAGVTQSFGAIAPGSAVTRPFTFVAAGNCGNTLTLTVNLSDAGQSLGTQSYNFRLGAPAANSSTFKFTGPPAAIPDGDARGINVTIPVSGFTGPLADLNVRFDGSQCTTAAGATTVGLAHDFVGDLVVKLTSPQGTTIVLMDRPGSAANSGRNFCQTVLDDDSAGATSIQQISPLLTSPVGPPYSSTFNPANPLAAFDGENPNGNWTLNVADLSPEDTGTVRGVSLVLSGFACCQSAQPQFAYEGDVAPRPNGNGAATAADWTMLGRMIMGLVTPTPGSEFQRADCAPRETLGNGALTAADFTQAGRYVAGLDPLTPAGGPLAPNVLFETQARYVAEPAAPALTIPARGQSTRGFTLTLAATGAENALSTTLRFDSTRWQFVAATTPQAATLLVNETRTADGLLGLVLALPANQTFAASQVDVVQLTFQARAGHSAEPLTLQFCDEVIGRELADVQARVLKAGNEFGLGVSFARFTLPERQSRKQPAARLRQ
ncbi:MAG: proprotein convertase P-domain-containing protein [Acidobacteria bacterium]|nr:proprotein convertase P-domain-containing protein [Acidobacteriota bacterium]MBI3422694.1 proprotein convertase P-domain-containing protein [Acidobacteriota bacterium]